VNCVFFKRLWKDKHITSLLFEFQYFKPSSSQRQPRETIFKVHGKTQPTQFKLPRKTVNRVSTCKGYVRYFTAKVLCDVYVSTKTCATLVTVCCYTINIVVFGGGFY
jgi:hypothetical protein